MKFHEIQQKYNNIFIIYYEITINFFGKKQIGIEFVEVIFKYHEFP